MKSVFFVVLLCCQSAAVFAADKISLVLDWFVNPVHSQVVIAQQKGFFAAQDLEVTLSEPVSRSGIAGRAGFYDDCDAAQYADGAEIKRY